MTNGSGAQTAGGERAQASAWALVAVLLIFFIFSYLDRTTLALVVDPVSESLGIDDVQISLLTGISLAAAYAAAGVPLGWLADRYDRRYILFGGVVFWGLATAACGLVHNFEQFFVARMMIGLGEASLMPTAHSMISDRFSRKRLGLALSVYSMGATLGSGIALIGGGFLINHLISQPHFVLPFLGQMEPWRLVFFATGLPGAALGVLILLFKEPARRRTRDVSHESGGKQETMLAFMRRRWGIWVMFTVIFGGMNVCNAALVFWQPAYMSRFFHWNPAQYGLGLGLTYAVAGVLGMLTSGWMIDRLMARGVKDAPLRYYLWALIISTPFVLVALLTPNVWVYLGLIWMAKFAMVNFLGLGSAAVQLTTPPHLRGRMAALFTTVIITLVGGSIGASVPAIIARDVLHDEVRIGRAIAVTVGIFSPLAILTILIGLRTFRRAVSSEDVEHTAGSDH